MFTLAQARALQLEAELGTDEILFFNGLPLTAPSPKIAPSPPRPAPAPATRRKSLDEIAIPDLMGAEKGRELLRKMEEATTISDLFALQRQHLFYRRGDKLPTLLSGVGPVPARLLVVAGRFQAEDFQTGIPFSGQVGAQLQELFRSVQLPLNLAWQTALFKAEWSQRLLPREKQQLRDLFSIEVALVRPTRLIVLGEPALEILLGRPTLLSEGKEKKFAGVPIDAIAHPLQWKRSPELRETAREVLMSGKATTPSTEKSEGE